MPWPNWKVTPVKLGKATREAYGLALKELGREVPELVVFDADLSASTMTHHFAKEFPHRFFNMGIQEAHMVGAAAGMASCGKIPFVSSFSSFLLCKAYDQIRMAVAYSELPVKLVGSHGGISLGQDGVSQMATEDAALTLTFPGFAVVVPADEAAATAATRALVEWDGPAYMRVGRPKAPIVYEDGCPFTLGKAIEVNPGNDITLIGNGLMVSACLEAARQLEKEGISARVLDMHTVKPLDHEAIGRAARETGRIVVAEEHTIYGGLGSVVAQSVARQHPVPMGFVALQDTYAESGEPEELFEKYGLTAGHIAQEAKRLLENGTTP